MEAYQLAVEFKRRVYKLVKDHPEAWRDLRYRSQVFDAVSGVEANLAEGWRRYRPAAMGLFLRYALGSVEEAKTRVLDGVDRGYFTRNECEEPLTFGRRCGAATMALLKSLQDMDPGDANPPPSKPRKPRS